MVTFMCASRITLPPFQYSKGGLMTRPLRENNVEDEEEEEGGMVSAEEESANHYWCCHFLQCNMFIMYLRVLKTFILWLFTERLTEAFLFALMFLSSLFLSVSLLWLQEKTLQLNKNKSLSFIYLWFWLSHILTFLTLIETSRKLPSRWEETH